MPNGTLTNGNQWEFEEYDPVVFHSSKLYQDIRVRDVSSLKGRWPRFQARAPPLSFLTIEGRAAANPTLPSRLI